jgi:hypothetical protein
MINYTNIQYDCHGIPLLCADFTIKRHDTRPVFKVDITDCDLPIDLTNLVVEASMWTNAKLKTSLTTLSSTISFADNIGFEQINLDTIIQVGEGRAFERMLIQNIDEEAKTVSVLRGQLDTNVYSWKKGVTVKLLRFLNNPAIGELEYKDVEQLDGTITENQLVRSTLVYEWLPGDTCMAGKYFLEFKVLSMTDNNSTPVPSQNTTVNYHCDLGANVEWARRFPNNREGFVIEVFDSPTAE